MILLKRFKIITEPYLYWIPIIFIVIFQFFPTTLFIPAINLNIEDWLFFRLVQGFMLFWILFPPFRKISRTFTPQFAIFLLPVEFITLLIMAQYYFVFALILVGLIPIAALLLHLIIGKVYVKRSYRVRRWIFRSAVIICSAIILSITLIVGTFSVVSHKPIIKATVSTTSTEDTISNDIIEESFQQISEFEVSTWEDLSLENRTIFLQSILYFETSYLKLDPQTIEVVQLDDNKFGSCFFKQSIIRIDYEHLKNDDLFESIDTVCHEAYHAYEYSVVNSLDFSDNFVQTSPYFEKARSWNENFNDYSFIGNDYCYQPLEVDARLYAEERVSYYMNQLGSTLKQNQQFRSKTRKPHISQALQAYQKCVSNSAHRCHFMILTVFAKIIIK